MQLRRPIVWCALTALLVVFPATDHELTDLMLRQVATFLAHPGHAQPHV